MRNLKNGFTGLGLLNIKVYATVVTGGLGKNMKITDKIYIDKNTELDSEAIAAIEETCTYDNPEYFQKMNLGLSVWNTPENIKTFKHLDDDTMIVLRGEAMKIKPHIGHLRYDFDHPDHPINLSYINEDFDLDAYQEAAIEAMTKYRQGIIHAVTSAGKSLIIVKAISQIKQRALIVVHRKILMKQLLEDINKYIRDENGQKIQPGIIGDGSYTVGDITIGIDKTLLKHLDSIREEFGVVILDECHLAPANTIYTLINSINAKHRFGLSGTLRRKDQKEFLIYSTFGTVIATISKEVLLDKGRVVPVEIKIIESETRFDWDSACEELGPTKARHLQEKTIALDPSRNDIILSLTSRLPGKTIVLSRYVEPCYKLQDALGDQYGLESGVITGRNSKEALESYEAMKKRDLKIIFATIGCVSTGVSISDLDNIVLISPVYTNELMLHQIRGRLMRTAEGKTHGTLYFVYDPYIFPGWKLSKFIKIMRN